MRSVTLNIFGYFTSFSLLEFEHGIRFFAGIRKYTDEIENYGFVLQR